MMKQSCSSTPTPALAPDIKALWDEDIDQPKIGITLSVNGMEEFEISISRATRRLHTLHEVAKDTTTQFDRLSTAAQQLGQVLYRPWWASAVHSISMGSWLFTMVFILLLALHVGSHSWLVIGFIISSIVATISSIMAIQSTRPIPLGQGEGK